MRIAINGFERLRKKHAALISQLKQIWKKFNQIEIVAINDLGSPSDNLPFKIRFSAWEETQE